jgi:hypothetical protein
MKIVGIVGDLSTNREITFQTEPALTPEVFKEFTNLFDSRMKITMQEGNLVVSGFGWPIPTDLADHLDKYLSIAATAHEQLTTSAAEAKKKMLENISETLKRPLV